MYINDAHTHSSIENFSILFHLGRFQFNLTNCNKIHVKCFKRSLFIAIFTYLKCACCTVTQPIRLRMWALAFADHFRRICFKSSAIKNNRANVCGNECVFILLCYIESSHTASETARDSIERPILSNIFIHTMVFQCGLHWFCSGLSLIREPLQIHQSLCLPANDE